MNKILPTDWLFSICSPLENWHLKRTKKSGPNLDKETTLISSGEMWYAHEHYRMSVLCRVFIFYPLQFPV